MQPAGSNITVILISVILSYGCSAPPNGRHNAPLFELMDNRTVGIDFRNDLTYTEEFNAYTYRNFYNGGGVGIGDINNDGLSDIYFCGNMVPNRLYLNLGDFRFKDITATAGVASEGVWSTGVSMADINGDGWLDIYICKSGDPQGENRHNELFINNGDLTFSEQSRQYGIADKGLSTHAAFFDYDLDGDLDCYLLNNSFRSVGGYDLIKDQRLERDTLGGNKLYQNNGERFTDVSEEAGIYGSMIGFGLGVTVGDIDRDGWPDIYVSNDFFERDYLYINQRDGTFKESLEEQMTEISLSAMGADMADLNHDGLPEVFVTDMLPQDDARMKTTTTFENWDKYHLNVEKGYHRQFTRNTLQLNLGQGIFSEIGRLSGTYATDWSWGALIADFDNDGNRDIFVANGIYKDLTDQDYINYMADPQTIRAILSRENEVIKQLIDSIPSHPIPNYLFANNGDLTFTNCAEEWGLAQPSHSNGSAYGDLDNDGDLDLVISNVNMPPFIYRNHTDTLLPDHNYLKIQLQGIPPNNFALGAQITGWSDGLLFYHEVMPTRGFQSTVEQHALLGLGTLSQLDSLTVIWPGGGLTSMSEVKANQTLHLKQPYHKEDRLPFNEIKGGKIFEDISNSVKLPYQHQESDYTDFDRTQLIYHMLSSQGPCICIGDLNQDGLDDLYLGGSRDTPGSLFIQQTAGDFELKEVSAFIADQGSEDTDCVFLDADNDGDLDLYVTSGSTEYGANSSKLLDRLYLNTGRNDFEKSSQLLPSAKFENSGTVEAADFDADGLVDLFVGIRSRPDIYGAPVNGYLLKNTGAGSFKDVTAERAPELLSLGMITDAVWDDFDSDGDPDVVVVGEWMAPTIFKNEDGSLYQLDATGLDAHRGFWNTVETADLDLDGDQDLLLGNHGQNTRFRATEEKPIRMYINDFDANGQAEQIITVYNGAEAYPLALRHDLINQLPELKKKYLRYQQYREQTIEDIFSPKELANSRVLLVTETRSCLAVNESGHFSLRPLPREAQLAPVYGLETGDFNYDGHIDILLAGNFTRAKPEVGIYAASYGLFLSGDGELQFKPLNPNQSGFMVPGETRAITTLKSKDQKLLFVAKNNDRVQIFKY